MISGIMWSFRKYPYRPPPPTHGGQRKFRGRGGRVQKETIFEGWGWGGLSNFFFEGGGGGAPSKIDEQTNSYFTVNRCSKAKINVFIDDLFLVVG